MMILVLLLFIATAPVAAFAEDLVLPVKAPSQRTIEYREVWRSDPYSDEYLMGNVRRVTRDRAGNFYFLDTQLQEVFKFDSDGNYLQIVARKGEGPGEIDQTWNLEFWPPDQIVLPRSFPPQIVRVDPEGTPLDELRVVREGQDSPASVFDLDAVGDLALVRGNAFTYDSDGSRSEMWIGVVDRDGNVLRELASKTTEIASDPLNQTMDEAAEYWEWGRYAVHPDGHLFRASDRETWVIERMDLEGNVNARFTRDIGARVRVEEEFEELRTSRSFVFNGQRAKIEYKLLDTEPPIRSLSCIKDQLWVFDNAAPGELADNVFARAAVLTLDGKFLEAVEVHIEHDPELDYVVMLPDGSVVVIENGVAANQAAIAAFRPDDEEEEDLSDAEPAVIVVYEPVS